MQFRDERGLYSYMPPSRPAVSFFAEGNLRSLDFLHPFHARDHLQSLRQPRRYLKTAR